MSFKFQIPDEDLQKILNTALSRGGDFAEIFLEHRNYNFINMEEDIIKETAESVSLGLGIRVISGEKTGYGYTNDLSIEKMKNAALTAAAISSSSKTGTASPFSILTYTHNYYPVCQAAHKKDMESKITMVRKTYDSAFKSDSKIQKVNVLFADQIRSVTVINSEGLNVSDSRPLVKLTCLAIAEKNGLREAGFSGGGGKVGLEYFQDTLSPEMIGKQAAREALNLLEAVQAPAGEFPVVLEPGHSGVLIHESVGHLLEADFIRKKTSLFWNKQGKKVGSEQVNIFDDPTIPNFRGSYNIDDEGVFPQKTELIRKGVLTGLLQDRLSSRVLKRQPTGHGRRQDYTCIPIPRMSNTYLDKGKYDPEEIIKSVKYGLYAHQFQGGQVEDSGKFTFSVNSGFLIEDGKCTRPVKQATLIGNSIDILNKIEMVGSDLTFGLQTGTCGKDGQAAPVTDGCPTIKLKQMTVGGRQ